MTTARDIMHTGATCIGEHETLDAAAQHMRDLGVGALPICGADDRLHGMLTDRDIVINGVAAGLDLATTTADQLAQGNTYYVDADANIQEMLNVMEEHQVRRLPVIDNHRLVDTFAPEIRAAKESSETKVRRPPHRRSSLSPENMCIVAMPSAIQ